MRYSFSVLLILVVSVAAFSQNYLSTSQDVGFDVAIVIAKQANLRLESSTSSLIIATFNNKARLTLLDRKPKNDVWFEVSDINTFKRGWIHGNSIEIFFTRSILSDSNINATIDLPPPPIVTNPCKSAKYQSYDKDVGFDAVYYNQRVFALVGINETDRVVKILDMDTGNIKSVRCSDAQILFTHKTKSTTDDFIKTCTGTSSSATEIKVENKTDRLLTLYIGEDKHLISPYSIKTIHIWAGMRQFIASAPRIIPLSGQKNWEGGCQYSWSFWISNS